MRTGAGLTGWIAAAALAFCAAGAAAQDAPRWDGTLSYTARDTLETADGGYFDNDRILATLGASRGDPGRGFRAELSFGVRNEFFEGSYPVELSGGAVAWRGDDARIWGVGLRAGAVEGRGASGEVGLAGEVRGGAWTLRGLGGVQGVSNEWPGSGAAGDLFVTSEASAYPFDWLVVRAGASWDSRGDPLAHLAGEVRPGGGPFGAFAEWTVSSDEFRGEPFYNDFRFGLSLSFGFDSLLARDRAQNQRLMWRPVSAQ